MDTRTITLYFAWWFQPWFKTLCALCWLTGMELDPNKVWDVARKAVRFR